MIRRKADACMARGTPGAIAHIAQLDTWPMSRMSSSACYSPHPIRPACPIRRIHSLRHQAMKGRKGPIGHPLDQAMLEWIDVSIIHVRGKILVVANQVLPTASLPDAAFGTPQPCCRAPFLIGYRLGEMNLDQAPSQCMCSGSTTHACILKGCARRTERSASRRWAMWRTRRSLPDLCRRFTVKKEVPPGEPARR